MNRLKSLENCSVHIPPSFVDAVSYLHSLLKGPIQFLFHFLLQEARGFCLLHSGGCRLETAVVARGVAFVNLRAELLVDANDDHTCRCRRGTGGGLRDSLVLYYDKRAKTGFDF